MKNKSENSNIIKFNPDPSREEAMSAVKTLIAWAGDNPNRAVSYTHLRAHETLSDLVCRLLLEKKKTTK